LDIAQVTFGKSCRIFLLKSGKVWAEGRNKCKHFFDTEGEISTNLSQITFIVDHHGVEIPFYDKKDKIVQISTFF
jgi:hypothetical protein